VREIKADIASDPDEAGMTINWNSLTVELPKPKASLHMRIDQDILEFSATRDVAVRPALTPCCVHTSRENALEHCDQLCRLLLPTSDRNARPISDWRQRA
jgi:hypothetical protein